MDFLLYLVKLCAYQLPILFKCKLDSEKLNGSLTYGLVIMTIKLENSSPNIRPCGHLLQRKKFFKYAPVPLRNLNPLLWPIL